MHKSHRRLPFMGILIILPFIIAALGIGSMTGYVALTNDPLMYFGQNFGLTISPFDANPMPGLSGISSRKEYVLGWVGGSSQATRLFCSSYDNEGFQVGTIYFRYWECS